MFSTPAIAAIAWAVLLGGGGGVLTEIGPWYRNLRKPIFQPPDWLFGPAWTIILGLAAWAGYIAYTATSDPAAHRAIIILYAVNFVCHFAWSPLFFKLKRPDWSLIEVVFLWCSCLSLCIGLRPYSVEASWLVAPYLAWVSFAAKLNFAIVKLNPPRGCAHCLNAHRSPELVEGSSSLEPKVKKRRTRLRQGSPERGRRAQPERVRLQRPRSAPTPPRPAPAPQPRH